MFCLVFLFYKGYLKENNCTFATVGWNILNISNFAILGPIFCELCHWKFDLVTFFLGLMLGLMKCYFFSNFEVDSAFHSIKTCYYFVHNYITDKSHACHSAIIIIIISHRCISCASCGREHGGSWHPVNFLADPTMQSSGSKKDIKEV